MVYFQEQNLLIVYLAVKKRVVKRKKAWISSHSDNDLDMLLAAQLLPI